MLLNSIHKATWFIAWRYFKSKRLDNFAKLVLRLAVAGIAIGVSALILILSVMNGLEDRQKTNLLNNLIHALVTPKQGEAIANLPTPDFVTKKVPINQSQVLVQSDDNFTIGNLVGVNENTDDLLLSGLDISNLLPKGSFNVVIASSTAYKFDLKVGSKIKLTLTEAKQFTPLGILPVSRIFTVSGIYFDESNLEQPRIFANINDVGRLLHLKNSYQGVRLFLNDPFDVALLDKFYPADKYQITDWRAEKGEFFQAIKMEKNMMGLLVGLIIVVSIVNIITAISIMVSDKRAEIAILQTQGLNNKQIIWLFVLQGVLISLKGILYGLILAGIAIFTLPNVLNFLDAGLFLPVNVKAEQILLLLSGTFIFTLICSLIPSIQVVKFCPALVLKHQ